MTDLAAQYAAGMATLTAARTGQMVDSCTITRPAAAGPTPVLDADGNVTGGAATQTYAGPCTLARYRSAGVRATIQPTVSDASGVPEPRTLLLPHGADARSGDLLTMTVCPFAPELAGQTFRVLHEDPRTFAAFRSFTVRGSSWQAPA